MLSSENKAAYSVEDFCDLYGIGRTQAYEEVKAGRLKAKKVGRRTIITPEAGQEWLASLPSA